MPKKTAPTRNYRGSGWVMNVTFDQHQREQLETVLPAEKVSILERSVALAMTIDDPDLPTPAEIRAALTEIEAAANALAEQLESASTPTRSLIAGSLMAQKAGFDLRGFLTQTRNIQAAASECAKASQGAKGARQKGAKRLLAANVRRILRDAGIPASSHTESAATLVMATCFEAAGFNSSDANKHVKDD